ncbi:MAG: hypothetical protein V1921_00505 [Candidatus Altiarchaeota archaeon]
MREYSGKMLQYLSDRYKHQERRIRELMRKNPDAVLLTVIPNAHLPFYTLMKNAGYNVGDRPGFYSPVVELFNADEYLMRQAMGEKIPEKDERMGYLRDFISNMVYGHLMSQQGEPAFASSTRKTELNARKMTDRLSDEDVLVYWTKDQYIKHYSTPKFTHEWVQERLDRKKNVN